jgi:hypothetical protein
MHPQYWLHTAAHSVAAEEDSMQGQPHARTRRPFGLVMLPLLALVAGCSDQLKLDGNVNGQITTAIKLEGPVQLQMQVQGPIVKYEGTYISDDLFGQIQVSKATDDWILAVLGEPDARSTLRNGTEIWRWTYRPTEQQASIVELWTKTEKEPKLAARSVFLQIKSGVVIEKWKG